MCRHLDQVAGRALSQRMIDCTCKMVHIYQQTEWNIQRFDREDSAQCRQNFLSRVASRGRSNDGIVCGNKLLGCAMCNFFVPMTLSYLSWRFKGGYWWCSINPFLQQLVKKKIVKKVREVKYFFLTVDLRPESCRCQQHWSFLCGGQLLFWTTTMHLKPLLRYTNP